MANFGQATEGTSTMEKMKKILSSPILRKKSQPVTSQSQSSLTASPKPKYFGVPLADILLREGTEVPHLVTKICAYMLKDGVSQEGIFRVNGNAKVIEKIKQSFEMSGDANLDIVDDVMAVAAVLKLFLRELPNGLIPEAETLELVRIQEVYRGDKEGSLQQIKMQLELLNKAHYTTLKYLCDFLVSVTEHEASNKMNPMALGIVFGPNIFRCTLGIQGLKEQGITNHITLRFIQDYNTLFPNESPIPTPTQNGKKRPAPPRPPPPKFEDTNGNSTAVMDSNQIVIPRKGKQKYDGSVYNVSDGNNGTHSTETRTVNRHYSNSDDEYLETGRFSPFPLETDRSEYSTHTSLSLMNHSNTEVVEKAISSAVTEHLFGAFTHESSSFSSEEAPVRPPRKKQRSRNNDSMEESFDSSSLQDDRPTEDMTMTIKQRIQQFEVDDNELQRTSEMGSITNNNRKQLSQSKAFQMFEQKGIVIGPATNSMIQSLKCGGDGAEIAVESDENSQMSNEEAKPQPRARSSKRSAENRDLNSQNQQQQQQHQESDDSGFNSISRVEGTLASFKKPAGPKNRRNPTRRSIKGADIIEEQNQTDVNHNHSASITNSTTSVAMMTSSPPKPSTRFLNLHFNGERHGSPEKSPSSDKHPFVPPLDLSILHEHGDGSEPIPVKQGLSISLHKVQPGASEDKAMISPRSDKMQKGNLQHDPEIPPSPPMEQTKKQRAYRIEDDYSQQVKTLTKRIQTCKRKIKNFEENFEADHGYRPSQTDKAARPEIKKYMQDLARTRKELRRIKEEQEHERATSSPPPGSGVEGGSSTGEEAGGPATMKETLHVLMKRLTEKRQDGNRPEDLMLMSHAQVQEEKLAVQKALLHFESLHGRPATKAEKELMRPLYDRYRNIKRLMTKTPFSPTDQAKESLQTVPEDHTIEFDSHRLDSAKTTFSNRDAIRIPTAEPPRDAEDDNEEEEDDRDKNTFLVTRDMRLLGDTVKQPSYHQQQAFNGTTTTGMISTAKKGVWMTNAGLIKDDGGGGEGVGNRMVSSSPSSVSRPLQENVIHSPVGGRENNKNLHEMTYSQLLEEQSRVKSEKKRLRKILREFEDEFYEHNGEKVQKEDRAPMDIEYREYKQIKARLKLLEALLSKHGGSPDL